MEKNVKMKYILSFVKMKSLFSWVSATVTERSKGGSFSEYKKKIKVAQHFILKPNTVRRIPRLL